MNQLVGSSRVLVNDLAGTTRDPGIVSFRFSFKYSLKRFKIRKRKITRKGRGEGRRMQVN